MALLVWNCFFCLLPSLLVFLLCLALRWSRSCCWIRPAVRAAEPRFICKPTALAKYLLQHCGSLAKPRLARWPRGDPHVQTVCTMLWGQYEDTIQFSRDNLLLRDQGIVALDWAVGTGLDEAVRRKRREDQSGGKALGCFTSTPPILLLIPQCWGGMSAHLKALCHRAMCEGFYVVVFHPRGTAGCPLTTTRLTEFGDPADLEQAVAYIHSRHPSSMLVAVSEGSGSGLLLSYLGERGSSTYLTAAAAISPVLQGQQWFEAAMSPVYRWWALFHRKLQLRRYAKSFRGVLDVDQALSSSSLRDFEETLFCSSARFQQGASSHPLKPGPSSRPHSQQGLAPSVAWALGERASPAKDWDSYWERNEPLRDADEVALPVLCICSRDDPLLQPSSALPISLFQSNPYFFLVLTDKGGHCGFTLEGREEMEGEGTEDEEEEERCWSHIVVLEYFRVVADFLKVDGGSWGGPAGEYNQAGPRNRTSNMAPLRRKRATMMKRLRQQIPGKSSLNEEEENFIWKRSYTR